MNEKTATNEASAAGSVPVERGVRHSDDLFEMLLPEGVSAEWLEGYRQEVISMERERIIALLEGGSIIHAEHDCRGIYGEELRAILSA